MAEIHARIFARILTAFRPRIVRADLRHQLLAAGAVLVLLVATPSPGGATCSDCPGCVTIHYVRSCSASNAFQCNDANDGLTPQTAWATLNWAANYLNTYGNPGDAIVVGPGTYREGNVSIEKSGIAKPARPIQFLADPTGTCTDDTAAPVVLDVGNTADTGFLVFGASNVAIDGFQVTNANVAGVQIRPDPTGNRPANVVVSNNMLYSNGQHVGRGVDIIDASGVFVFNNLIYKNLTVGIGAAGTPQAHIVNNTLYSNGGGGIVISHDEQTPQQGSPSGWVINNIIDETGVGAVAIDVDAPSSCNYIGAFNLIAGSALGWYSTTSPRDPSDLVGLDPGFAAASDGNFALEPNSAAIDAASVNAHALGLDMSSATGDDTPDSGPADLGFHAGNRGAPSLTSPPLTTKELYVRSGGNDLLNDGSSPSSAFATVTGALLWARAQTQIIVGPGVYPDNIALRSNKPAGPLELLGDSTGLLTGDTPGWVLIDAQHKGDGINDTGRCGATIDGFDVTNAQDPIDPNSGNGIAVKSADDVVVRNNVLFSNAGTGINVADSDNVDIFNNLAYANGSIPLRGGGIQIGGDSGSKHATVQNNTCYQNGVNGIDIGAGAGSSSGATLLYNISENNGQNGIHSLITYGGGYNLLGGNGTADYGGSATRQTGDIVGVDALFVDPAGPDGQLGGSGFTDDEFELQQQVAGGTQNSPAIDAAPVTAVQAGLDGRSTRIDGAPDLNALDLGYHYPLLVAVDLYVGPNGSDSNSGSAPETPLQTITAALDRANPGTTVHVAAGTYAEGNLRPGTGVTVVGPVGGAARAVISAGGASAGFDLRAPNAVVAHFDVTGSSSAGIRVRADRVAVIDCWAYANADHGIVIPSNVDEVVFDNVVYGNGGAGIVIGSNGTTVDRATVAHNTVYGNTGYGITIGLGTTMAATNTAVVNNVVAKNTAGGIAAGTDSATSLEIGYNCNADGYRGIGAPAHDIAADALLIAPADAEQPDFHLSQVAAGQMHTSPCVDAGFRNAAQVGLDQASTRTDAASDTGEVDIGYHYGLATFDPTATRLLRPGPSGDCDGDGVVRVNEVIIGVDIALGEAPLAECPTLDTNDDGKIMVNELLAAVQQLLQ